MGQGEERPALWWGHPEEVRDAQVAPRRAPAQDRDRRPAVPDSHAVGAAQRRTVAVRHLLRGGRGHQEPDRQPSDGDTETEPHRPGRRLVPERLGLVRSHPFGQGARAVVERGGGAGHAQKNREEKGVGWW